ncbi:MAG: DNA recombination protein RmuC [Pseudomonadota bacterium]|nr:DNA recombination protein RmuC [Gammaproteobacteria bacterium]MEE2684640.1 DNA recombination protein RmuC [Pseudomonadota bacterium]|tara:strand:- start:1618 stop:2838 length:1221 start_codon:yes stop_codon:yes gene_type:complete
MIEIDNNLFTLILTTIFFFVGIFIGTTITRNKLKDQKLSEEAQKNALLSAKEDLTRTFNTLANSQLSHHTENFLKLAKENLKTQQEKASNELFSREKAVENLVNPIKETLSKTQEYLNKIESTRQESHGSIKAQLESMAISQKNLTLETQNLVSALRRPEVRGQWGEISLQRLVELAGMVEHCDFITQDQKETEDGIIRPDMVINMPDNRQVIVDVKTPLDAYLDAIKTNDKKIQEASMDRHAINLLNRIKELSSKSYWSQFENSPEFVILFIPGDQFLSAALSKKPELLDDALRQHVILATPTSLVALLKAIAYGWQQVALTDNAREIRNVAAELYDRLTIFTSHLTGIGKDLNSSVKSFNKAIGSLENRVLSSARKFTELGIKPKKNIDKLKKIDEIARIEKDS